MKITLLPHDSQWTARFAVVKQSLLAILHGIPLVAIEHVGSTSVPGLLAKPVLDVDIVVQKKDLAATRKALSQAGYLDQGECGVPGRFQFRQPGFSATQAAFGSDDASGMRMNTYVMIENCLALRNHLDVRHVLSEDQDLREEYALVKRKLAERDYDNVGEYSRGKSDILYKILQRAGWTQQDYQRLDEPI